MEKKLYYTLLTLLVIIVVALAVLATAPPNGHDISNINVDAPIFPLTFKGTSLSEGGQITLLDGDNDGA